MVNGVAILSLTSTIEKFGLVKSSFGPGSEDETDKRVTMGVLFRVLVAYWREH